MRNTKSFSPLLHVADKSRATDDLNRRLTSKRKILTKQKTFPNTPTKSYHTQSGHIKSTVTIKEKKKEVSMKKKARHSNVSIHLQIQNLNLYLEIPSQVQMISNGLKTKLYKKTINCYGKILFDKDKKDQKMIKKSSVSKKQTKKRKMRSV